ncbi:winged helix DNA-binding domain-containing protein [Streptomyces sp. NPDC004647]|uniref:winged helix DNA-binding domain-containing protein n=1 Tax=Streptomyces sp. NPDC004647 TaxID=3154671 RepID=UPI0033B6D068
MTKTTGQTAAPTAPAVLGTRALNRAFLDRQLLLRRSRMSAADAVEHLVGVHAQVPKVPYYALWARLADFRPEELSELLSSREAVRIALQRSTLHLVTARDCLALRPLLQEAQERRFRGSFGKRMPGVDLARLEAVSRALVEEQPLMFNDLGKALTELWPDHDALALSMAARTVLPLVQIPPRALWGQSGLAKHTTVQQWLGQEPEEPAAQALERMLARYLAAFGPASVRDMQMWSGLTRLREVTEGMRPRLRTFRDAHGVELFDVPDGALPDPETTAPVRFLPEFDNLFLAHQDRTRVIADAFRNDIWKGNQAFSVVLVDGFIRGVWRIGRERDGATLVVEPFERLSARERADIEAEGARLLEFAAPDATHDVRIVQG